MGEECAASGNVGEVETDAFDAAFGFFVAEEFFFVIQQGGQIDFNPVERGRQIHTIGAGVEAGGEVDDGVHTLRDLLGDELIVEESAHDQRPGHAGAEIARFGDLFAARASEASGERVAEKGVAAIIFEGADVGDGESGVGNVANERFG